MAQAPSKPFVEEPKDELERIAQIIHKNFHENDVQTLEGCRALAAKIIDG